MSETINLHGKLDVGRVPRSRVIETLGGSPSESKLDRVIALLESGHLAAYVCRSCIDTSDRHRRAAVHLGNAAPGKNPFDESFPCHDRELRDAIRARYGPGNGTLLSGVVDERPSPAPTEDAPASGVRLYDPGFSRGTPAYVKVKQDGGAIEAELVEADGRSIPGGCLFRIDANGTLVRYRSIDPEAARRAGIALADREDRAIRLGGLS